MTSLGRPLTMPEVGDLPLDMDPHLRSVLEAIIQTIDIREGRQLKGKNVRFVTIQDLIDAGLIVDGAIT